MVHSQAGLKMPNRDLVNIPALVSAYYTCSPQIDKCPEQAVSFGTSGHRGSSLNVTFNEAHIVAMTQAVCDYRRQIRLTGPLFLGMDTHALSLPAHRSTLSVLIANGVSTYIQMEEGYTPTPVISFHILNHNRDATAYADGIVITPSHNPPEDGGFKYNARSGGPADEDATRWIQQRANHYLSNALVGVHQMAYEDALKSSLCHPIDFKQAYIEQLDDVIDMSAIRDAGIRIAADPLGGSGIDYWESIAAHYDISIRVVNPRIDPTFGFMPRDKDGKIRMDCSSAYAMQTLLPIPENADIAIGNDPDFDRHGIVTRQSGLLNPNHYLAVCIDYLFRHRDEWPTTLQVGKTLVSSAMIDRVAEAIKRDVYEVPVGFKWFVKGLEAATLGFAGEESAGATFLRKDGQPWTTDKDGIVLGLLAAEIQAVTQQDPGEYYQALTKQFGAPLYQRIDAPASGEQRARLKAVQAEDLSLSELAGDPVIKRLTEASGNQASIGGIKVVTERGWFAARPSGTEDIYKIYTESFVDIHHLETLQAEAKAFVTQLMQNTTTG